MTATYFDGRAAAERWLVFESDGESIAVAYYVPERLTNGTWNLLLIAVRPDRQNGGVGRSLMAYVERDLRASGARALLRRPA